MKLNYLGDPPSEYIELIRVIKSNKLRKLCKEKKFEINTFTIGNVEPQNVATFHQLSSVFHLPDLAKMTSEYIQRCFTIVAETKNFLELDFRIINKILSSSELNITSEVEIFKAADAWLRHKIIDGNIAESLFLQIRFPLLSDHVIKSLFDKRSGLRSASSFHEHEECLMIMQKILKNKDEFYKNKSNMFYTNRYCNNRKFNLLFFDDNEYDDKRSGETHKRVSVYQTSAENLQDYRVFLQTKENIYDTFCLKGKVYFLFSRPVNGGCKISSFMRFSPISKIWETLTLDNFYDCIIAGYCVCTFMDSIFIMGGFFNNNQYKGTRYCCEFNVKTKKWRRIANMNQARINADSAVFEGRVVMSGGTAELEGFGPSEGTNTIEAYDHVSGTWSYMPSMVHSRYNHQLFAVGNRLFATGGNTLTCEVYDSVSKRFTALKLPPDFVWLEFNTSCSFLLGRKFFVFHTDCYPKVVSYHVDEEKWSEESFEITKHLEPYDCMRIQQFHELWEL